MHFSGFKNKKGGWKMKKSHSKTTKRIKRAIVGVFICTMGLLLCRTDGGFAASAKDKKRQTVAPSSAQTKPGTSTLSSKNSKINQLLQQLMQAQTLKQYSYFLKNIKLIPLEQEELNKELAKPQYTNKVKRLFHDAKAAAEAGCI